MQACRFAGRAIGAGPRARPGKGLFHEVDMSAKSAVALLAVVCAACACAADEGPGPRSGTVWPGDDWQVASPVEEGMDTTRVEDALSFAGDCRSEGVVVVRGGRIVAERYWGEGGARARTAMFSATKSVVCVLVGIAIGEGLISGADQKASDFLTEWKSSGREEITIRHLLSMTSGLAMAAPGRQGAGQPKDDEEPAIELELEHEPGTEWEYNTRAYRLLFAVIHRATGRTVDRYSKEKLFGPLGMKDTAWKSRKTAGSERFLHVESTCRDMARFGLMVLRGGGWNGAAVAGSGFLKAALSPSQSLNRAYGWLWWLNGSESHMRPAGRKPVKGMIFPDCPDDAAAALGAGDKKIYIVPSLDLVVTRLGPRTGDKGGPGESGFDNLFLHRVCFAVSAWKGAGTGPAQNPPQAEASVEAFMAAVSRMQHARIIGDVAEFRACAEEARRMWSAFPREVREALEKDHPGIGERAERGFE